jgi:co-chaperonin GroES (HSP10)
MHHEKDPKQVILDQIGDLSGYDLAPCKVLVGIYQRPEKTAGGIILSDKIKKEDIYQGVVGLVLKVGPGAFEDDDANKFHGFKVSVGDWVEYKPSDTEKVSINGVECRRLADVLVKAKISHPDLVI